MRASQPKGEIGIMMDHRVVPRIYLSLAVLFAIEALVFYWQLAEQITPYYLNRRWANWLHDRNQCFYRDTNPNSRRYSSWYLCSHHHNQTDLSIGTRARPFRVQGRELVDGV
jgi:hypothetical protein